MLLLGKHIELKFAELINTECYYREYISRDSEGSGVPEMKAVLAGVHLHKFLAINALVGKFIGIVCALAGGLSMGR